MTCIIEPSPVICNNVGHPICDRRKDLVDMITNEVTHPDKFNPTLTWSVHKKYGRVEALFQKFQVEWSLPDNSFKWFNEATNNRWRDHINRRLKCHFDAAKGNFIQAISNRPRGLISEELWLALCEHFRTINTPDPVTGKSKSANCTLARKLNKQNHGFGRTPIARWSSKYTAKYNTEPTAGHVFDKGYLGIDALKSDKGSSTSDVTLTPRCNGPTMLPQLLDISDKLHKGVEERIKAGEGSIASSETVLRVFGKPKLGISHHKIRK